MGFGVFDEGAHRGGEIVIGNTVVNNGGISSINGTRFGEAQSRAVVMVYDATVLAGTITMTPGTVSCDLSADGRSLLVHCLDAPDAEEAVRQMKVRYEARLKEIFP